MTASKVLSGSECLLPGSNPSTGQGRLFLTVLAPCPWISSNGRLHRMQVVKLTAAWREAGKHSVPHDCEPFIGPVHVIAHIWKLRRGRYDAGNLYPTVKAIIDGIVDSGLIADDSNDYVMGPDLRHGGIGPAGIVLDIHRIGTICEIIEAAPQVLETPRGA